ncbi:MAG: hypothetical protein A2Y33_13210 [Spirochaetes bacterium GWF1_51_8]|nr:MAG: hypothetical protein A2Y33_13210 [Spirochaetes bacterium GWF1_51_8]
MPATDPAGYWDIKCEGWLNKLKDVTVKAGLFVFGRAFQAVSKLDSRVQDELLGIPEGFTLRLSVFPEGPSILLKKSQNSVRFIGTSSAEPDMHLILKSRETAVMFFTGRMGVSGAFAGHRLELHGDLNIAMTVSRCIAIVQRYLFPAFVCERVMRGVPAMGFLRQISRLLVYLLAIPFGLI